jgi:hypothetical protein
MLKKRILLTGLVGGTLLAAATTASAQSVEFYFTEAGSTTPITSLTLAKGQTTLDLSVWYVVTGADFQSYAVDAMVGYDTSNSYGGGATPLENVFALNGTTSTAITNVTSAYQFNPGATLTGGQTPNGDASNVIRPYGVDVNLANFDQDTDPGVGVALHVFDISLTSSLKAGQSADIVLYDAGTGGDSTSFLMDENGDYLRQGGSTTLVVKEAAVPEPASLIALGLGAVALIRRRRSR